MIKHHQHDDPPDEFFEQHQRITKLAARLLRFDLDALLSATVLLAGDRSEVWGAQLLGIASRLYERRLHEAQMRLAPPSPFSYCYGPSVVGAGQQAPAGTWIKGPWVLNSDTSDAGVTMYEARCVVCTKVGGFSQGPGASPITAENLPDACPQCGSS